MTEVFYVSEEFDLLSSNLIQQAVKKSKLPEGINIVRWHEHETAKKPFAVVVYSADWEDVRKVMEAGAETCIPFSLDVDTMTRKFNKEE